MKYFHLSQVSTIMFPVRLGFSSCADHNRYFANISKRMFSQRDITRNILHCSVGLPFYHTVFNVQAFHFITKACFVFYFTSASVTRALHESVD